VRRRRKRRKRRKRMRRGVRSNAHTHRRTQ